MTLIKSISGIRGTIGGQPGGSLSPFDVVKYISAYTAWMKENSGKDSNKVVVGRDARLSGEMINNLVNATFQSLGVDVIDIGLTTTPTVEIAVTDEKADGGIIITASHNPKNWNALKLLNEKGEFLSASNGERILEIAESGDFNFAEVDDLGTCETKDYLDIHIQHILDLDLVDVEAIKAKNFKVAIDCVNSSGGVYIPALLKKLGVNNIVELFCDPTGHFPHNPEPLPENLREISSAVVANKADVGIVVDPDVDRLALVCENGEMFGEEYTLVSVAEYVLKHTGGNTVSNLSSTRALRDVTELAGYTYNEAAVGEVNVVEQMKATNAVIGGEGNGGVIYPAFHYGRDALVGIALFLSHLAKMNKTVSELRNSYPNYFISKNKIELTPSINVDELLEKVKSSYSDKPINDIDGVKIAFDKEWVHLRKSNTEPIIRIYAESESESSANGLAEKIMADIKALS
ncbi:MAG: phosphoglucosamine mutase [Flavobacteriales bacterium]|nr:phosphoglucosamine mutase [Flavobacteriales bacterium]